MKKQLVGLFSFLAPDLMVSLAYQQLNHPQVKKLREHEEAVLATAERRRVPFKGKQIQHYHWLGKGRRVLLVHGWEGQAGNFADIILKLREQDCDIHTFDGPSHGHSETCKASPIDFCDLVLQKLDEVQPQHVISHSFGGVPTSYALSQRPEMPIESYVILTTPDRFLDRIDEIAKKVGMGERAKSKLKERLQSESEQDITTMNVSNFIRGVRVKRGLVLHDVADRVIPIAYSQRVQANWENSRFEAVQGTGHFRILRDPAVIDKVVAFSS